MILSRDAEKGFDKMQHPFLILKNHVRDPWVAQRFSVPAFGPGRDPGVLGSSPTSGSLHGVCFSLCLCLCLSLSLSLSLSLMNK